MRERPRKADGKRAGDATTLAFLGGARTVTGSKHLVRTAKSQVLLDCGMFQGQKELRLRNWRPLPLDPEAVSAVVLSHAHIDHSGALPLLFKQGFRGPVYCTPATADLLAILLLDAARLQEEEAAYANRHGYSKHRPALPLYTAEDVEQVWRLVEVRKRGEWFRVADGVSARLRQAGHILGSAIVELEIDGPPPRRLVFSGDLGRWKRPILHDPEYIDEGDVVLVESTYGDRVHPSDPTSILAQVVNDTVERGGVLIVPAFAVGRTQELVWALRHLEDTDRIPVVPVFVDSPMASHVTQIYARHRDEHDVDMQALTDAQRNPLETRRFELVRSVADSREIGMARGPMIVIAGSGMATGGRVLHHLRQRLPDERNTVLLTGFQAAGTRGRSLQDGAKTLRMFGEEVTVRAKVVALDGFSAHADRQDILRWLRGFRRAPRKLWLVHGEPEASASLCELVEEQLGWNVSVAEDGAMVPLDGDVAAVRERSRHEPSRRAPRRRGAVR
ncbi:MAG TPA: MBL fold metallo-hydrolase [Candidatus Binatia bacterium]